MELASIRRLVIAAGVTAAVVAGWKLANGEFVLPALLGVTLALFVAARLLRVPPDAFVTGIVLVGYLVGNRGFAQLNAPGIPLLPGEAALGLGLALLTWRAAVTKTLPVQRRAMDFLLLTWIALGTARVIYDVRVYGIMAVRDYALVYYALFFFLAQGWAADPAARRWLERCLDVGFALTTPAAAAFALWPETLVRFSIAGAPLIFVKGDVAGSFMAAGAFWFGARYSRNGSWVALVLMSISVAAVVLSNSRAALVALALGAGGAVLMGDRRMRRALGWFAAAAVLLLVVDAMRPRDPGTHSRALRLYESVRSATDFSGTFVPTSAELNDKPDNNRFRVVWWQSVLEETRAEGPWLGLGFGRDLADEFVRRYYADNSEEFNTRSPHNFLLTILARMGVVGLVVFLAFVAAAARRMWVLARAEPDAGVGSRWLAPAMILISACFGVVLEGPMGAAVFWATLGLAHAQGVSFAIASEPKVVPNAAAPARPR